MSERMVIIKNMVNGQVGVKDPVTGINRRWEKKNHATAVPFSTVEQLLWQNGFRRMIDAGILYIEDLQTKIDLGLEPEGATKPVNIIALNENEIKNLLTTSPIDVFKKEISNLPKVQVDNVIEYAIQNKLVDPYKCTFLKELTGKDIFKAISSIEDDRIRDLKEAEREKYAQSEGRRI